MSALLKKEARLLFVPWISALALTLTPSLLAALFPALLPQVKGIALFGFAAGIVSLSLASMGREITSRTFSSLLALPLRRQTIWRIKSGVAIAAAASVCGALFISLWFAPHSTDSSMPYAVLMVISLAAASLATGLLTTILLRQVAASMCFTILVPVLLTAVSTGIAGRVPAFGSPGSQAAFICLVLSIYASATFWFARSLFLRAEDVPWTGGVIEIPLVRGGRRSALVPARPHRYAPFSTLLRKELQLQRFTFVSAGCVGFLHLIVAGLRWIGVFDKTPPDSAAFILLDAVPFLWLFVALLGGATSVADERRTGIIETQLCLPAAIRKQFSVKAGVVFALALAFGSACPLLLDQLAVRSDQHLAIGEIAALWIFGSLSAALLGLLASTLTRGLSEALSAAVGLGVALLLGFTLAVSPPYVSDNSYLWPAMVVMWVAPAVLFVVGVILAARNWRRLQITVRDWLVTVGSLGAAWISVLAISSFIYFRPWELVTPLEPSHGAPRFNSTAPPQLAASYWWISVVLPDGRMWVSKRTELEPPAFLPHGIRERFSKSREDAAFLNGSDWRQAAATFRHCVGVKKDGTLWEIQLPAPGEPFVLTRIGETTNWISLSSDATHFLALRSDGTLWSWGNTWGGQLGIGRIDSELPMARPGRRKQRIDEITMPAQVGGDSDWAEAWALGGGSFALKKDGTQWAWGAGATNLFHLTSDSRIPQLCAPAEKLRPVGVSGSASMRAWVRANGTLWVEGSHVPPSIFGLPEIRETKMNTPLTQIGAERQWKDVAVSHDALTGLASNGQLWKWQRVWPRSGQSRYQLGQLGTHSDWLAVHPFGSGFVSLAADGSLWCWNERHADGWIDLTAPRRKPVKIASVR